MRSLALALMMATGLPALAADPAPLAPPGPNGDIPPAEWRSFAPGKTLTYTIGGQFWAYEQYHPSIDSDLVWIELADGTCMSGRWAHENGEYCFYWEANPPACFRHARKGGQILVIPVENGAQSGDIQIMSGVSETPLKCSFGLSS